MARHRTVYSYSRYGDRCTIRHAMRRTAPVAPGTRDRALKYHLNMIEGIAPRRPGPWQLVRSGALLGAVDADGWKPTYWTTWRRDTGALVLMLIPAADPRRAGA